MARGWESKSIDEQIEASREELTRRGLSKIEQRGAGSGADSSHKMYLLLARTRVLKDMATTENERYRHHLQITLAAIEKQLLEFQ